MTPETPKYDAAYFIAKFEAIPEEMWMTDDFTDSDGRCCARGHCGERSDRDTKEAKSLVSISRRHIGFNAVAYINDARAHSCLLPHELKAIEKYMAQTTPKQRVLAWLRKAQEAGL